MGRNRKGEDPNAWNELARLLSGSFAARARGLVSPGLVLLTPENVPFGHLLTGEAEGTRLRVGDLEAEIHQVESYRYVMTTGGAETLTAEPAGSQTLLTLRSGDRRYKARISLLRNSASAVSSTGDETARLSGGLTNRRYRATFDPQDPAALLIAFFLLHHTVKLRSSAYRAARYPAR